MERLVERIRAAAPDAIAIYLFGSAARGDGNAASDLDLALLTPRPLDPAARFALQEDLAALARRDVDLVDLRSASTVMRVRVLRDGRLLYEGHRRTRAEFEMYALSDYARLNEERRGILEDARRTGKILG
jgi:uncharacterized protein